MLEFRQRKLIVLGFIICPLRILYYISRSLVTWLKAKIRNYQVGPGERIAEFDEEIERQGATSHGHSQRLRWGGGGGS